MKPGKEKEALDAILLAMDGRTFGQRESASIVGGLKRLIVLMEQGKIRAEKRINKQNGKWYCNAADVLRYAKNPFIN